MSAKTWMKWLSVIALLVVGSSILFSLWSMISGEVVEFTSTELTALLLAIVAVISSFAKK
jgi:hypothetical protein